MRLPLEVRLDTPDGSRRITREVSALRFGSAARGGYASVEFDISRRLDDGLFSGFADVLVFDAETAEQVGGGRLIDQGRSSEGTWHVTALGEGIASLQDNAGPLFYVEQGLDEWVLRARSTRRIGASIGTPPDSNELPPGLLFEYDEDRTIYTGAGAVMWNRLPRVCNQLLGAFGYTLRAGATSSLYKVEIRTWDADNSDSVVEDTWTWNASASPRRTVRYGTDWFDLRYMPAVRVVRTGDEVKAFDETWVRVADPTLQARVYDKDGSWRTGSWYATESIKAHEVFIDLCRRRAPRLDIGPARVDESAFALDQLSWPDGISSFDVMEEVLDIDPAFTWAVWNKKSTGRWETEFTALPQTVRYEATAADGFNGPAPSSEIYDGVYVVGVDRHGRRRSTLVRKTNEELDAAGIGRTTTLDLGDEVWSPSMADRRGSSFLDAHAAAPNAGTLRVARRVFDRETGRWVAPWAIRAGELVRVRGVQPLPGSLNRETPDGLTVFRIVSVDFDADDAAATLELDTYTLTERRALARLMRLRGRRRR
jgi:hypothetical protein